MASTPARSALATSTTGVDATIERICSDEVFAAAVVRDGASALNDSHDLTDDERDEIANALRADFEDATGDVEGFTVVTNNTTRGGSVNMLLNNLSQMASLRGSFDRTQSQLVWPGS